MIRLAALDMAGTTIDEGGTVYAVLDRTVAEAIGRRVPPEVLAAWTGTSKSEAVAGILTELGEDASRAPAVYATFAEALDAAYAASPPTALPGVEGAIAALRDAGVAVALQTGYTRQVAEQLLATVGWEVGRHVDALVTADDVARSRPAPYLVFRAMEQAGVDDVADVLVAGDTPNDLRMGGNAGASLVVGVLTGAGTAAELGRVRHTHLLPSARDLPELLAQH